jgi:hypothetical protein
MAKSISVKQKKRGRPATGVTPMIGVRLSAGSRKAVEKWALQEPDQPSLSEAVRRLIDLGLSAPKRKGAK